MMEDTRYLAEQFDFFIICGATGSAKTRILQQVEAQGGQILDLETLASTRARCWAICPGSPSPARRV